MSMAYLVGESLHTMEFDGVPPMITDKDVFVQHISLCEWMTKTMPLALPFSADWLSILRD